MLLNEFIERTNVEVSAKEYIGIIEPMYNNCEIDKDQFCAMWCKMHPERVKAAKAAAKAKAENNRAISRMFDIVAKLHASEYVSNAAKLLCNSDNSYLEVQCGINPFRHSYQVISDLRDNIHELLECVNL